MALRLNDEPAWHTFLTQADIPDDTATEYAKIFVSNRVNERAIKALTKEHLRDIGIKVR